MFCPTGLSKTLGAFGSTSMIKQSVYGSPTHSGSSAIDSGQIAILAKNLLPIESVCVLLACGIAQS